VVASRAESLEHEWTPGRMVQFMEDGPGPQAAAARRMSRCA